MTTETEWRRRWKSDVKCVPWQPFVLDDEDDQYMIKVSFTENSYELYATDLKAIWHESLDADGLKKRTKKLNPNVEAPLHKIVDHIRDSIEEKRKGTHYSVKLNQDGGKLRVSINNNLAGCPFVWQFDAAVGDEDAMLEQLTKPLLLMVGELGRRQQELCKLLRAKDKEIEDYKAQGVRASRKHLDTGAFDEMAFVNDMVVSTGFEEQLKQDGQSTFDASGQDLYRQVMMKQAWLNRDPHQVGEGDSLMDEETTGTGGASAAGHSWMDRVPGSVTGQSGSASPQKRSPQKSPVKPTGKSPETSPVKDTELMRRQALERKLQNQLDKQEKPKKKKKMKF